VQEMDEVQTKIKNTIFIFIFLSSIILFLFSYLALLYFFYLALFFPMISFLILKKNPLEFGL